MKHWNKKLFLGILVAFIIFWGSNCAIASIEPIVSFPVENSYDLYGRTQIAGQLIKTTNKFYIYADQQWWSNLSSVAQNEINNRLYKLSSEFEYKIYPRLTQFYGPVGDLGFADGRLLLLIEPLKTGIGGYVKVNRPHTIYLSASNLSSAPQNLLYYELAHEFTHIITFKLKPNEDIWLNELRAEYAETLFDYNNDLEKSNLRQRIKDLLLNTKVNLVRWENNRFDYAVVNLLGHYLVEQYGLNILADSLHAPYTGIESINYALHKNGSSEDFSQVFRNWLIAVAVNDCSLGSKYCYQNPKLKGVGITPYSYYLPTTGYSSLSVTDSLRKWSGKWLRITGGRGMLKLKWKIPEETPISKVPYIVVKNDGSKYLGFFDFSSTNESEIYFSDFGKKNISVLMIPFLTTTDNVHPLFYYSFEANTSPQTNSSQEKVIQELLQKIAYLKQQIALLQAQLAQIKAHNNCSFFLSDLHYGTRGPEVSCLQQFLKNQGPDIYPEGLVTGYFGPLTKKAVQRFQAKYSIPSTGYFGPLTRATVNQLLR